MHMYINSGGLPPPQTPRSSGGLPPTSPPGWAAGALQSKAGGLGGGNHQPFCTCARFLVPTSLSMESGARPPLKVGHEMTLGPTGLISAAFYVFFSAGSVGDGPGAKFGQTLAGCRPHPGPLGLQVLPSGTRKGVLRRRMLEDRSPNLVDLEGCLGPQPRRFSCFVL